VEPLVSKQWWMSMKPLAEPAIKAVEDGRITFVPANWSKTYFEWMYNIRDWCISRQLWWGHRIPAWHCGDCKEITVARETPTQCGKCGSVNIVQETDVLDTWFSSGLWPFSTLGWPDDTPDQRAFYPTSLLVTGFDIIFFWAARMIMFGIELTGEVPFPQIHIHGLVRDAEKQKMSKTKGNVVDPLVINDKFGTDAVRFGLLVSAAPGGDIALSEERLDAERAFANKIWNASRLLFSKSMDGPGEPVSLADRWITSRLSAATDTANRAFEHHRYHEAADTLYHFWWDEFCDWYLELKKLDTDWSFAYFVYEKALRLLHPLMPFITEELWQRLETGGRSIALAAYPRAEPVDTEAEREMKVVQDIVTSVRVTRAESKIDKKVPLTAEILVGGELYDAANAHLAAITRLTNTTFTVRSRPGLLIVRAALPTGSIVVDRARLEKENAQLEKQIANLDQQFADQESLAKKPERVIAGMREKKAAYEAQLAKNRAAL
jgi:valyl-tRNA synthetase